MSSTGLGSVHASQNPRTLADRVVGELHLAILQGEFDGGSHLRITELAERFDTSAMPVREALRRLAGLGLVEILPHRGARVLELSVDDLEDTYRTRVALETLAITDAAARFTSEQQTAATAALAEHERLLEVGDVEAARHAHTRFHFLLYEASGSRWLLRAIEPVWQNSERYRFASGGDETSRARSHTEHLKLLEACAEHDVEAARSAMAQHLSGAHSRMRAHMATIRTDRP